MKEKRYIVKENYMFGTNYYNSALQVVPDYTVKNDEVPTVDFNTMSILVERNPYLQVVAI